VIRKTLVGCGRAQRRCFLPGTAGGGSRMQPARVAEGSTPVRMSGVTGLPMAWISPEGQAKTLTSVTVRTVRPWARPGQSTVRQQQNYAES
jgi:hypothetical protein